MKTVAEQISDNVNNVRDGVKLILGALEDQKPDRGPDLKPWEKRQEEARDRMQLMIHSGFDLLQIALTTMDRIASALEASI